MRRIALFIALGLIVSPAVAGSLGLPNELVNGNFEQAGTGWASGIEIHGQNDFGVPANGTSTAWAGAISSWGGNWDTAYNSTRQVVDESQFPGWIPGGNDKLIDLSFDTFLASRGPDTWRNVGLKVYVDYDALNGVPVPGTPTYRRIQVYEQWRDGDPTKWAGEYAWNHVQIPDFYLDARDPQGNKIQPRFLSVEVETYVHFGEWSWVGVDNIDLEALCTPEPVSLAFMALAGISLLRRRR